MAHLAEKLKYARDRIGLKGHQVGAETGIGTSSISDFETGKRVPSLAQLTKLARVYNRSTSFFIDDSPIPRETVLWRERPTGDAQRIETNLLRLADQYRKLELFCNDSTFGNLPKPSRRVEDYYDAELLASQVRNELNLGERPGGELLRVLEESCCVKVFYLQFEPTGTAASSKSSESGYIVLLNSDNKRWRRNFDLAHELFHLLTWDVYRPQQDETSLEAPENEEQLANCFARNLLLPRDSVIGAVQRRSRSGKLGFAEFYDIAREFDVSVDALLWRLHYLYNWEPSKTEGLVSKARQHYEVYETRESYDVPPDRPMRFKALAIEALHTGRLSIGRFAEYMGISRTKAFDYAEQEADGIEQVPVTAA